MQILMAKLAEKQREERLADLSNIRGEQRSVGFGSQIRSYVMQPYQMVKDLRSGYEVGNVESVFDGDLDGFMEAYLQWERSSSAPAGESSD
jgi:peptide chain release factor 2